MQIRSLVKSDAVEFWQLRLLALRQYPQAFGASYEDSVKRSIEQVWERFLESPEDLIFGAFNSEQRLIGMVGIKRMTGTKLNHKCMIWGMYVLPDQQGAGVGRKLMQAAIEHAKQVSGINQIQLSVVTSNHSARNLYLSLGFEIYGVEKQALKVGNQFYDEEHMVLFLNPDAV